MQLPDSGRRRRLPPATTAVIALITVAVAVGLATRPDGGASRPAAADDQPGASTTVAPQPVTTVPGEAGTVVPSTVAGSGSPKPTTAPPPTNPPVPKPAVAPDRSRPEGIIYTPDAVWPETLAELDRLQAAVDQGHQPWRTDPVAAARAYLLERGLPAPDMAAFHPLAVADTGRVDYTSGGTGGTVFLQRLLKGSIWFVTHSRTDRLPGVKVTRSGGTLAVEVRSDPLGGDLTIRAKRPGGEWGAADTRQLLGYAKVTLGSGEMLGEFIVQLRHDGGGHIGLTEVYLDPAVERLEFTAVDAGTPLRVDGLGRFASA